MKPHTILCPQASHFFDLCSMICTFNTSLTACNAVLISSAVSAVLTPNAVEAAVRLYLPAPFDVSPSKSCLDIWADKLSSFACLWSLYRHANLLAAFANLCLAWGNSVDSDSPGADHLIGQQSVMCILTERLQLAAKCGFQGLDSHVLKKWDLLHQIILWGLA